MPVTVVDRLPVPNMKVYMAGSVLVLSAALYQAIYATSEDGWRNHTTKDSPTFEGPMDPAILALLKLPQTNTTRNVTEQFLDVLTYMMQEPFCMWTVINMAYCSLALFGLAIQRAVFGALRVSEAQRLRDKFWNYVFYKFIFVFGVINVQYMDEVLLWCSWFSVLGFLHLLAHLSKDRFEYMSSSPTTTRWQHFRLLTLVTAVLMSSSALLGIAVCLGLPVGKDTFAFMAAECILVQLRAGHTLARYLLRAWDVDVSAPLAYYTHLVFDVGRLLISLCDVVHMVVYSRVVVSMGSLVLLLQLRHLLARLRARLSRHARTARANHHMTTNYPMASKEEVEKNQDNCAICWEPMKEARKLPCDHLFHNACLCQWVVQDASCPTCRRALTPAPSPGAGAPGSRPGTPGNHHNNHLFHFDGSRYVSWLPSFSVEVTRVRASAQALDEVTAQVSAMFPQVPRAALAADLSRTRSLELTVHHILEGGLEGALEEAQAEPQADSSVREELAADSVPHIITDMEEAARIAAVVDISATETVTRARPVSAAPLRDSATDTNDSDIHHSTGQSSSKFAIEASERESMLQRRKEQLIADARKKYLERMAAAHTHS